MRNFPRLTLLPLALVLSLAMRFALVTDQPRRQPEGNILDTVVGMVRKTYTHCEPAFQGCVDVFYVYIDCKQGISETFRNSESEAFNKDIYATHQLQNSLEVGKSYVWEVSSTYDSPFRNIIHARQAPPGIPSRGCRDVAPGE